MLIFQTESDSQRRSLPYRGWLSVEVSQWTSRCWEAFEWPEANQFNQLHLNFLSSQVQACLCLPTVIRCPRELFFPAKCQRNFLSHTDFPCFSQVLRWYLLCLVQDGFCLPSSPFLKIWLVLYRTLNHSLSFILWAILRFSFFLSCGWTVNYYVATRGTSQQPFPFFSFH